MKLDVEAIDDTLKLELKKGNKILWENAEKTKTWCLIVSENANKSSGYWVGYLRSGDGE